VEGRVHPGPWDRKARQRGRCPAAGPWAAHGVPAGEFPPEAQGRLLLVDVADDLQERRTEGGRGPPGPWQMGRRDRGRDGGGDTTTGGVQGRRVQSPRGNEASCLASANICSRNSASFPSTTGCGQAGGQLPKQFQRSPRGRGFGGIFMWVVFKNKKIKVRRAGYKYDKTRKASAMVKIKKNTVFPQRKWRWKCPHTPPPKGRHRFASERSLVAGCPPASQRTGVSPFEAGGGGKHW